MFLNIQAERVPFTLYNHVDVFITDSYRVSEVINNVSYIDMKLLKLIHSINLNEINVLFIRLIFIICIHALLSLA